MLPISAKLLNKALACFTLIYCSHLSVIKSSAQDEASSDAKTNESTSAKIKFDSLSQEQKQTLRKTLMEAANLLNGIRVQESLEKIIEAESMVSDFAPLYNLKGAAYTKIRDFDKAQAAFERAVLLYPSSVMTKFNLTEMHFVKKNYPLADKEFSKFLLSLIHI